MPTDVGQKHFGLGKIDAGSEAKPSQVEPRFGQMVEIVQSCNIHISYIHISYIYYIYICNYKYNNNNM